jgi:ubiquinone/menaquinone biosynthesis C-methylase UbiE
VDLTERAVAPTAERRARGAVPAGRSTWLVSDIEHLPFSDRSFDFVSSRGVLHHSPDTTRDFAEA